MKKELFDEIITSLKQRIAACDDFLGEIHNTEAISKLPIYKALQLKHFCIAEEELMTKICMVDLYHIIGMGNLSPTQMMTFTYAMQEYLSYRPTVKVLAQKLDSIESLPKLPVKTRFRLLGLGNATLTYGEGNIVDEASIDDYTKLKASATTVTLESTDDIPFNLQGGTIEVNMDRLDYFIALMNTLFKTSLSVDKLKSKINNQGEYLGIKWISLAYDSDVGVKAIGNVASNNTRQKLMSYLKK